ncbi:MAG: hypothetical protein PF503_07280 [Desulfobacula sp.]|jgi:hypothetical protein|nr:hypothetical protein [Desulfobacula sp.]
MYLSEEKRAEIRKCLDHQKSCPGAKKRDQIKDFHDTEDSRKICQILFDARDGKELFTPF